MTPWESLLREVEEARKKHQIPGIGLAWVTKEGISSQGLGFADLIEKKPVREDTIFRIGSISKSFLAMAFLKLQEQGRVDLEAPIRPLLGNVVVENPWEKETPLRIVHLLEHTAGFDEMRFPEFYNIKDDPKLPMERVLAIAPISRRSRWRPGTWVSYANPGYGLAGYLLEQITKEGFEKHIEDAILRPLGMREASFEKTPQIAAKLAEGYEGKGLTPAPKYAIYHRPAGAMYASAAEVGRLVQCLLHRGSVDGKPLLSKASIERMERPTTGLHVRKGLLQGYGLANFVSSKEGVTTYGHDGGIDGFLSSARYSLDHGAGYVLLVNQSDGGKGFREIEKILLRAIAKTRKLPPPPLPKRDPKVEKAWIGTYKAIHSRNELFSFFQDLTWFRVTQEGEHLFLQPFALLGWQKKKQIYPIGKGYRFKDQRIPGILFAKYEGKDFLFMGMQAFRRYPAFLPHLYGISFLGALLLMFLSLLFLLIWLPRRIIWRRKIPYLRARLFPTVASLLFYSSLFLLQQGGSYVALSYASSVAVSFCVLTVLFAVFSVVGLFFALHGLVRKECHLAARIFSFLVALSCFGMMLFIWPLIGIRFWVA
jgi:CubicO group peptidase (beta-lactamase class C family)